MFSPQPRLIDHMVFTFTEQQMKLLNNGLNFAVQGRADIPLLMTGTETAINAYSPTLPTTADEKDCIRAATADAIKDNKFRKTRNTNEERKVIKELRRKRVYYIKMSIILIKYDNRVKEKL